MDNLRGLLCIRVYRVPIVRMGGLCRVSKGVDEGLMKESSDSSAILREWGMIRLLKSRRVCGKSLKLLSR